MDIFELREEYLTDALIEIGILSSADEDPDEGQKSY